MRRMRDGAGSERASVRPVRPSLPPTVPLASALWAGAALSYGGSAACEQRLCVAFAGACAAAAVLSVVALAAARRKPAVRVALLIVVGLSAGAAGGFFRAGLYAGQEVQAAALPAGSYRFEVTADARNGDFGSTCSALVHLCEGGTLPVVVRLPPETDPVRYGSVFEAYARFSGLSDASKRYYRTQGTVAAVTAGDISFERQHGIKGALVSLRGHALSLFDGYGGRGAAFLRAILLGDRSELENHGLYQQVKAVGLAHVVAVSGAHLSIVCALIGVLLSLVRAPKKVAVVLQIGFLAGYLVCAGMPVSGIRAALMASVALMSVYARRRSSGMSALSLCVCCIIAADPTAALSVSLALSVFATGGIIAFGGLAREWFSALLRGRAVAVCDALALTAASSVLVAPLSASLFSQVPLMSPVANLYAAPFFALFCGGGLVIVGANCIVPEPCRWALDALVFAAEGFCEGIGVLAGFPCASVPCDIALTTAIGISAASACVLWLAWPKPSFRVPGIAALCGAAFACSLAAVPHGSEVIMLDVGQGDAIVVRSGKSTVLIDTGNRDTELLSGLARNGVFALDAVIVSHPDDDHCASLGALDGVVRVGQVMVAADLLTCPCGPCAGLRETAEALVGKGGLAGLSVGDSVRVGSIGLRVVGPDRFAEGGGNADSLCLLMECDADADGVLDWTGLFCGDAEDAQIDELLESNMFGRLDMYKVGHHGSKAAIDGDTAAALSPSVSLVSVGAGNRYGHPARETLSALEDAGSKVYRTDEQGDVVCRMTSDRLEVSTHKVE